MGNNDRVKQRTRKSKKRKFKGNQFTRSATTEQNESSNKTPTVEEKINNPTPSSSRSESKVQEIHVTPRKSKKPLSGYRIIDVSILASFVFELCCPFCFEEGTLSLNENYQQKKGFASCLSCQCSTVNCHY